MTMVDGDVNGGDDDDNGGDDKKHICHANTKWSHSWFWKAEDDADIDKLKVIRVRVRQVLLISSKKKRSVMNLLATCGVLALVWGCHCPAEPEHDDDDDDDDGDYNGVSAGLGHMCPNP